MLVIAALCQNVIVYLESTIEALILLMKSKLAYIKTSVLPCIYIYNSENADVNLFFLNVEK